VGELEGGLLGGGVRVEGELEDVAGVAGVGAGVLGGDPGEQVGLAGQEDRALGGVAGAGLAEAELGEVAGEVGDVGGGDAVVVVAHGDAPSRTRVAWDLARWRWVVRSR
jgi:hypothetical protein